MFTYRTHISLKMLLRNFYSRKQSTIMSVNGCSDLGETFSIIKSAQLLPRVDSDASALKNIHLLIKLSVRPLGRQTPGRYRVLVERLVGGVATFWSCLNKNGFSQRLFTTTLERKTTQTR